MIRDPLELAKLAERAEIKAQRRAARAEAKAERRAARKAAVAERWPRWTAWWEARAKEMKIAATIVGSGVALVTGVPVLYRNAGAIAHRVKRAWSFYADRDVPPALPPPTGAPSTAVDFQKTRSRPVEGGNK